MKNYIEEIKNEIIQKGKWRKEKRTPCCFEEETYVYEGKYYCMECDQEVADSDYYEVNQDDFWLEKTEGNKDIVVKLYHVEYKNKKIILHMYQSITETIKVENGTDYIHKKFDRYFEIDPKEIETK